VCVAIVLQGIQQVSERKCRRTTYLLLELETNITNQRNKFIHSSEATGNLGNFQFTPAESNYVSHHTNICPAYPGRSILQASLMHPGQLMPMRLNAQTTTSTICPPPSVGSWDNGSEPGSGRREQISASVTKAPSERRSNDKTFMPLECKALASAASPHPRSTMTDLGGYFESSSM